MTGLLIDKQVGIHEFSPGHRGKGGSLQQVVFQNEKQGKGTSFYPVSQEYRVQLNPIITQLGMIIKIAIYDFNIFKVTWKH